MEKDSRDIGFEDFLREQTERHLVTPSERVWMSIHQRMHPKSRWPNLVAALALFGLGVLTGFLLDAESPESMKPTNPASTLPNREWLNTGPTSSILQGERNSIVRPDNKTLLLASRRMSTSRGSGMEKQVDRDVLPTEAGRVQADLHASLTDTYMESMRLTEKALNTRPASDFLRKPAIGSFGLASMDIEKSPYRLTQTMDGEGRKFGESPAKAVSNRLRRSNIQLYFSPSVSYRRLVGKATDYNYAYSGLPYSATLGFPTDVNKAVTHKPSVGMELGAAVAYPLTSNLRIKAGLQFNLNNYDIEAYNYTPEMAPLTAAGSPGYSRPINTVSYYRNFFGFSRTWLRNTHFTVSTPIGLELVVPASRKVSVNLASTIQPTYTIRNNSYLISTNLKNYAQEPSLYRTWNVNAGAEAYLSVSKGSYRWIMGPQIRYQLLSSYKENYPISEHLIDYGMKFGIQKTLR